MWRNVYMRITLKETADYNAIDELIDEKFPEADLWYDQNEIRFVGSTERSQELLRAIDAIAGHDKVYTVTR